MEIEKRSVGLNKSCILIIVVASVERFAYKGVASNLITYLTEVVKLSTSSAVKTVSSWNGVTSMLPLITAVVADSYWDRYSTIVASSLLYVAGLVGLSSWTLLYSWMPTASLFLPLYMISIGQGGYNPSLQAFGAEQQEIEDEETSPNNSKKSLFFQWWYFGICSGSLFGNSIMSYVQDNLGWGLGFAIPAVVMSSSVAGFLCGTRFYVHKQIKFNQKPSESIIRAAKNIVARKLSLSSSIEPDISELELQEKPLRDDFNDSNISNWNIASLDEPQRTPVFTVILRLLPVWTLLLMFAVIFQLPVTFFTKQGMAMRHNIGSRFVIPPAMLQSSITVSIILLMPLYDKIIIPVLRIVTRDDKGITVLQRIGIGMIFSILAMVTAALVEAKRLEITRRGGHPETQLSSTQLSIFCLLPQYLLLGVADVFTVVGMQEFFYTQVPPTMKTVGIALNNSVFGVGSFLSALLISVVELATGACGEEHSWFSDDMSEARLDKYYWLLALLSFVSFLLFAILCRYCYDVCDACGNGNKK